MPESISSIKHEQKIDYDRKFPGEGIEDHLSSEKVSVTNESLGCLPLDSSEEFIQTPEESVYPVHESRVFGEAPNKR